MENKATPRQDIQYGVVFFLATNFILKSNEKNINVRSPIIILDEDMWLGSKEISAISMAKKELPQITPSAESISNENNLFDFNFKTYF